MLARAGLGDDARLAHAPGEQRLAERVVDLVRARVREVLALEQHPDARRCRVGAAKPPRLVQRRWPSDVVLEQAIELVAERRVGARGDVAGRELLDRRDERLGDEASAVGAEVSARVGIAPAEQRPFR